MFGKVLVDILPVKDITQLVKFCFQGSFFECRSLEATVSDKSEVWGEVDGFDIIACSLAINIIINIINI